MALVSQDFCCLRLVIKGLRYISEMQSSKVVNVWKSAGVRGHITRTSDAGLLTCISLTPTLTRSEIRDLLLVI